jgi:hypothetical protein
LMKKPENVFFIQRWLMDPHLQAFGSVSGMWTAEKVKQLRADALSLSV